MAKRKQPRRQGSKGAPAWAWLLVGLFIGLLAFIGYRQYLSMNADPAEVPVPKGAATDGKKSAGPTSEPAASTEEDGVLDTDYSFYDVLPTEDPLDIPTDGEHPAETGAGVQADAATASPADVQAPSAAAKPAADSSRYLLQAGAFARASDADDLKARIALSGEAARVETAVINGKTMYRVRLGPYADIAAANAAKANLAGQGIKADSIKIEP